MFYAYLRGLVVFLLWIINGNAHYHNRDKLLNKDENYILVAPHRTWWDPVYMAFSARPKQLIMFPSGSRHSSDVKGGVAVIAKMAKVKIMPVVYQGPRELKGLLTGERVDMNYGNPIDISDLKRLNDENIQEVARRIQSEFDRLDEEALSYQTGKKPNPLTYIYRVPLGIVAIIAVLLTMVFSYVASFVWNPEKHRAKETQK